MGSQQASLPVSQCTSKSSPDRVLLASLRDPRFLVPKLRLGTGPSKLCFMPARGVAPMSGGNARSGAFPARRDSQAELGNERDANVGTIEIPVVGLPVELAQHFPPFERRRTAATRLP